LSNSVFCFDAWTVRELETDDMGHEHWDNDDSVDYQAQDEDDDNDDDHEIQEIEEDGDEDEEYAISPTSSVSED
jgi:hypothetical protein